MDACSREVTMRAAVLDLAAEKAADDRFGIGIFPLYQEYQFYHAAGCDHRAYKVERKGGNMDIVCSPAGIVHPLRPVQGIMDYRKCRL